jgi:uncharacterized membrane protein
MIDAFRNRRWTAVALALSVALNLAVAGMFAGGWLRHALRDGPDGGPLFQMMRQGDEAERSRTRAVFAANRPAFETGRAALRAARAEVRAAALADPFDPGALDSALADLRRAEDALIAVRHATFAALAAELSPERRAEMMRRLEKLLGGRRGHGRPGGETAVGGAPRP